MLLRPKNFVQRFKLTVRKNIAFQKRLVKLGPTYYACNDKQTACTRAKAKPRQGCPDCEFTIQTKIFREELEKELKYMPKMTWKGHFAWPVQHMLDAVNDIAHYANSGGSNRKWTVITDLLVKIYRNEINNSRAAEQFYQNLEAQTNSSVIDNDEGDYD